MAVDESDFCCRQGTLLCDFWTLELGQLELLWERHWWELVP